LTTKIPVGQLGGAITLITPMELAPVLLTYWLAKISVTAMQSEKWNRKMHSLPHTRCT